MTIPDGRPPYRIVDGKQRILAVRGFLEGCTFGVPGWWFREEDLTDPRRRSVAGQLSLIGRRGLESKTLPSMEYNPHMVWHGRDSNNESVWTHRTEDEMIQAEADLYLLINFGGTEQTAGDRTRAEAVARV